VLFTTSGKGLEGLDHVIWQYALSAGGSWFPIQFLLDHGGEPVTLESRLGERQHIPNAQARPTLD
jgi:hypothetical protein